MAGLSIEAIDEMQKAWFAPLAEGMTVEHRFGEIQGSRRWQMILKLYGRGPTSVKIWRTEADGKQTPLLLRSRLNNRRQDTVVKKYARGILSSGVVMLRPESLPGNVWSRLVRSLYFS